jgi:hypothetical protein
MAVILLIPHVLVILNPLARPLPILIRRLLKTQGNEVVDVESLRRQPRRPGPFHLEDDRSRDVGVCGRLRGGDDFDGSGGAAFHYDWNPPPLACDFEAGVAVWSGLVVSYLFDRLIEWINRIEMRFFCWEVLTRRNIVVHRLLRVDPHVLRASGILIVGPGARVKPHDRVHDVLTLGGQFDRCRWVGFVVFV